MRAAGRASCNRDGNPLESNVDDMLVVADPDNTPTCSPGGCGAGRFCLDTGTCFGTCCVPDRPAFMGTFLLVAGERNTVCVHHWCPEWRRRGRRDGYVNAGCDSSIDSIHLRFDETAILCPDDSPIAGGCT